MHFRSHSRGSLAKYKHKIEHWRVLGDDTGWAILGRLVKDGILTFSGNFYFLQPENVNAHLGISWEDLRKGRTSAKLLQYLGSLKQTEYLAKLGPTGRVVGILEIDRRRNIGPL